MKNAFKILLDIIGPIPARGTEKEMANAQTVLHRAIKEGRITKPANCCACGAVPVPKQLHGHHDDYSNPLEVMWLCMDCHYEVHRRWTAIRKLKAWTDHCEKTGQDPDMGVLPACHKRTGRPLKGTIYDRFVP